MWRWRERRKEREKRKREKRKEKGNELAKAVERLYSGIDDGRASSFFLSFFFLRDRLRGFCLWCACCFLLPLNVSILYRERKETSNCSMLSGQN
jgi:hypothetical protein